MRLKDELMIHKVSDETVVVPTGKLSIEFQGIIRNNETAGFIMELLKEDRTEEELVDEVLCVYDADRETVSRDVHRIVLMLEKEGLLQ